MNNYQNVRCCVCNQDATGGTVTLHRAYSLNVHDEFSIVTCKNCGFVYQNPRPDSDLLKNYYTETYEQIGNPDKGIIAKAAYIPDFVKDLYKYLTGDYTAYLKNYFSGTVIDIGCGFGNLMESLIKMGCTVSGIDSSKVAVEACLQKGLKVTETTLESMSFEENFYDTIVLSHVVEHIENIQEAFRKIFRALKPGGNLIIICPNYQSFAHKIFGDYWFGMHLPFHLYHFDRNSIKKFLEISGFETRLIKTINLEMGYTESLKIQFQAKNRKIFNILFRVLYKYNIVIRPIMMFLLKLHELFFKNNGDVLIAVASKP